MQVFRTQFDQPRWEVPSCYVVATPGRPKLSLSLRQEGKRMIGILVLLLLLFMTRGASLDPTWHSPRWRRTTTILLLLLPPPLLPRKVVGMYVHGKRARSGVFRRCTPIFATTLSNAGKNITVFFVSCIIGRWETPNPSPRARLLGNICSLENLGREFGKQTNCDRFTYLYCCNT